MTNRKEQLLSLLKKQGGWITARELSQILNVSDRTIRSDINAINSANPSHLIESNIRQGYRLAPEILSLPHTKKRDTDTVPQTPTERKNYIIKQLLVCRDRIRVSNLIDEL